MDQEKNADVERDIANLNDDEYVAALIAERKQSGDEERYRLWLAALQRDTDELETELRLKTKLREATLNLWARAHNP